MKEREPRRRVFVQARMRLGSEWSDVSIQNVSSRGMMARSITPPRQGAYVEVRKATLVIVARAVWVKGEHFGLRTQDRIDVEALLQSAAEQQKRTVQRSAVVEERRDPKRIAGDLAERTERNRRLSRTMQFGAFVAALGFAGWMLVDALSTAFAAPLHVVRSALGG